MTDSIKISYITRTMEATQNEEYTIHTTKAMDTT